jgi:hypothetical protein
MRGMRACAIANAIFVGVVCTTFGLASCSSGTAPVPPASPDTPDPAKGGVVAPSTASDTIPATAPSAGASDAAPKHAPVTPADCKDLASESVSDPSQGVTMNNAAPTPSSGASDRFLPLTDLIKSKRAAFRCCFDLWAKKNAGVSGDVRMVVKLTPDGSVKGVSFADTANRLQAPAVEACISDVAKSLTYPKSPAGKETTFTFPFNFLPHSK